MSRFQWYRLEDIPAKGKVIRSEYQATSYLQEKGTSQREPIYEWLYLVDTEDCVRHYGTAVNK